MPADVGEARHQGRTVAGLELVEGAGVRDAGDDLAHVEHGTQRLRHDAVDLGGVVGGLGRRLGRCRRRRGIQAGDDGPRPADRVRVVRRHVVGDARKPRVHVGAAQLLGRHFLAGRRLHQRRAAEEDRALLLDDDGLVGHRRHVGAAGRARAHDHGDLGHALRRHARLVVEDAPEMLAVGEHLVLVRQVGAAGIHQIDAGQAVLLGDLLRADVLLHGHRVVGAALDRCVVGDHNALAPLHAPDAGDDAGGRDLRAVEPVGSQGREFQERRACVDERVDPLPRQHLAALLVALVRARGAAFEHLRVAAGEVVDQRPHGRLVAPELVRGRIGRRAQNLHRPLAQWPRQGTGRHPRCNYPRDGLRLTFRLSARLRITHGQGCGDGRVVRHTGAARGETGPPVQRSRDASAAALVGWMAMILSKPILLKTRWMWSDSAHSANAASRFQAIFASLRTA